MWSEHCSYKSSRVHLKTFPTTGPRVLQGPGENAGVVDIGDGLAAAFKMESHNHPSYIEPYQGAATGVGGILRDVFTMGARPIASLNSLRFGDPAHPKTAYLLEGVVAGIGGYGNCIGVPTVGGEVMFHASYNGNCLVNAFTLGILPGGQDLPRAPRPASATRSCTSARRPAATASTARRWPRPSSTPRPRRSAPRSRSATRSWRSSCSRRASSSSRPTPWSASRTWARPGSPRPRSRWPGAAGNGLDLDIDQVPRREEGMTPYEVLLSESQERMLLVAARGQGGRGPAHLREVGPRRRGHRRGHRQRPLARRLRHGQGGRGPPGRPAHRGRSQVRAADDAAPGPRRRCTRFDPATLPAADGPRGGRCSRLLARPTIATKEWVYRQYDHMVRLVGAVRPGGDAAVVRLATGDGRPREEGHRALGRRATAAGASSIRTSARMHAVAECARNIACVGGEPLASPTASTSATPRSRRSCGSSPRRPRASPTPAAPSARRSSPGTSRSTTRPRGRGSSPRRPSGWSASSSRSTGPAEPRSGRRATSSRSSGSLQGEVGGSEYLAAESRQGGGPPARARPRPREGGAGDGAPRDQRGAPLLRARLLRRRPRGGARRVLHDARPAAGRRRAALARRGGPGPVPRRGRTSSSSARTRAGSWSRCRTRTPSGSSPSPRSAAPRSIRLGIVGGDRLVIEGALDVPVADLARAWRDGVPSVLRRDAAHFSLSNAS